MKFALPAILLMLLLAPTGADAQTAYVTDNLRLGLHQAEDTSDRAFRTLESGQELEVLSRTRNYAQVRLPDGTQGYVKAAYLVDDKPAKLIVEETRAEVTRLEQELSQLRESLAAPAETIASLEQQVRESMATIAEQEDRIGELSEENADYIERYSAYKYSLPVKWVGGALIVCLLAGFLGGLWWTDHRSRKRHGGIRIY